MEEFILPDLSDQEEQDEIIEGLIKDEIHVDMGLEVSFKSELIENNKDLTSNSEKSTEKVKEHSTITQTEPSFSKDTFSNHKSQIISDTPISCTTTPSLVLEEPNCSSNHQNLYMTKFIKTYSGKRYDKRRRGRSQSIMLFANGYTFHKSAVRGRKTHWICSQSGTKFKCRAAAATDSAGPIAENSTPQILYIAPEKEHKHPRSITIHDKGSTNEYF